MIKEIKRWWLFHDGRHNWDRYNMNCVIVGGKLVSVPEPVYLLEHCDYCGEILKSELEQFRGQGTICVKACECGNKEV